LPDVIRPFTSARSELALPENGPSAAEAAARKSLSRIVSQAFTTTVVVLAVVFDPPATGSGGQDAIAENDGDLVRAKAQTLRRGLCDDRIGAVPIS